MLAKKIVAINLILCIVPCLFMLPVFCGPQELVLSEEEDFCPLLTFAITSDALILAEAIEYPDIPMGFTLLEDIQGVFNLPVICFVKDKPPKF